ncbi:Small conductance calcium-activated potassium channel protein [Phytophthora citrophthora]|uniref:Small conductance calcium-activated potassium channel protein n=1 Tax=Phytophthora citrophthora TaxID=4793 RepID=A0AAD9GJD5_9STRA|nr:Small conductance calcium-activated potassium channel protein [Phytophthora citrophthora]
MIMLARRRSSRLDEERQAVEQHVEEAFKLQDEAPDTVLLRRNSSAYLPRNLPPTGDNLRIAKHVIQDVYSIQELYERQHLIENVACAIAMVGVILVILDNKYIVDKDTKLGLRIVNSILTKILMSCILGRYFLERRILIRRNVLPPNVSIFRMPKQLVQLALELAVCFIIVPPGTNGSFEVQQWKYHADDELCRPPFILQGGSCYLVYSYPFEVLGLFSLCRLYMIPRVVRNLSSFASYRTSYLGTLHRVDTMTPLFAIKCFLQSHPFRLLLASSFGTLIVTSYALAIVEAPVNPNLAPIPNAVWLVALTMATVGYGDIVPVTTAGQVVLVFGGMVAGILHVAALSAALFALLRLDDRDKRFIHSLRFHQHEFELKQACARSIQIAWRRFSEMKPGSRSHQRLCDRLFRYTAIQRELRKKVVGDYVSVRTEMNQCQQKWLSALRYEQTTTLDRLQRIETRLDSLVEAATISMNKLH